MLNPESSVKLRQSIVITLSFIGVLWFVKIFEVALDYDLGIYGIFPRTVKGSLGILTGPLVHGDVYHLLSNTFPILILGIGILYFYNKIAIEVTLLIYLMTGFWVWVAARPAYHIGASGLVYGLLAFLLISGFIRRDTRTLAISFIVFFLYGGSLFSGFAPTSENVSWESHILGAIAGIFCAWYFRKANTGYFQPQMANPYDYDEFEDEQSKNWHYQSANGVEFNYKLTDTAKEENEEEKTVYTFTLGDKKNSSASDTSE